MSKVLRCCRVSLGGVTRLSSVRRPFAFVAPRSARCGVVVDSFTPLLQNNNNHHRHLAVRSARQFSTSALCISTQSLRGHDHISRNVPRRMYATINGVQATELAMPSLSPTMSQGNISKWLKKEGDLIKAGDVIAEIETDKATLEFEMSEQGYLAKILRPEGSKDVQVGEIIAVIVDDSSKIDKLKSYSAAAAAAASPKSAQPEKPAESQPEQPAVSSSQQPQETPQMSPAGDRKFASPLARTVAAQLGVDLKSMPAGTGPNSRIIKADVDEFAARTAKRPPAAAAAPEPAVSVAAASAGGQFTDLPLSNVRKVIASRLLESKQNIPHYYLTIDCRMDELMRVRAKLNTEGKDSFKLSVNDFIIKAAALACIKVPQANSSWMNSFIRQFNSVDMSVAVQTDFGLITPIIKNADKLGLATISNTMKQLAVKARDNKLAPHEFQGGTFTISNLGMFGIKQFAAIINPPQACILAVGASEERLVLSSSKTTAAEKPFEVANFMTVTLSSDHRVVDGAVGAQWLQEFKRLIEDPHRMLL